MGEKNHYKKVRQKERGGRVMDLRVKVKRRI